MLGISYWILNGADLTLILNSPPQKHLSTTVDLLCSLAEISVRGNLLSRSQGSDDIQAKQGRALVNKDSSSWHGEERQEEN
ncbi:unnamed protein product [Allacma fusca]|uniref:Uncharacterized protein n=1 Tax=Allacma fusca TaxID=39272 RepID=A0A8J2NRZ7_9HEXA|nr:unnamed protein product [Allacma fusca]